MTNFIEEQQREAKEGYWMTLKEFDIAHTNGLVDALIAQTITNTLNHILESGLLEEEKDCDNCNDCEAMMSCPRKEAHNTLARDIKEFMSNMDKKTGDN